MVKLISRDLILFEGIVNWEHVQDLLLSILFLLYRKATNIWKLILIPTTLLRLLLDSICFIVEFLGFHTHGSSKPFVIRDNLISFSIWRTLAPFSCLNSSS